MTKVTYRDEVIDGEEPGREITSCGVRFKRGIPREVPDRLLKKFQGNRFFEVDGMPYIDNSSKTAGELDIDNSDEATTGGEEFYTAEDLVKILEAKKVRIPASAREDADALMKLVEDNGGL